jgi:hypothetical protein
MNEWIMRTSASSSSFRGMSLYTLLGAVYRPVSLLSSTKSRWARAPVSPRTTDAQHHLIVCVCAYRMELAASDMWP